LYKEVDFGLIILLVAVRSDRVLFRHLLGKTPPLFSKLPQEVLARSIAAQKNQVIAVIKLAAVIKYSLIVHRQRYHWGTVADSVL